MQILNYQLIYQALKRKNYKIFENDTKPYNLNIIGIRNNNRTPNSFDDIIVVMWKYQGEWNFLTYPATTEPGLYYLKHPANNAGTAILKEGQYHNAYQLGLHQGQYKALVQVKPVTVIRDYDKDDYLTFESAREETGIFGINIHRASIKGKTININRWSAGCQVFADSEQFNSFIALCEQAEQYWGKQFSYTLINVKDL